MAAAWSCPGRFRKKTTADNPWVEESECENCPLKFKAIADVPILKKAEQKQLIYSETLESGYQYVYMVRGYSDDGFFSEDSNYINFIIE